VMGSAVVILFASLVNEVV